MNKYGDYTSLARLARATREQSEYADELRAVVRHGLTAQRIMQRGNPLLPGPRAKIWAHLVDAIDLAERELERLGEEP